MRLAFFFASFVLYFLRVLCGLLFLFSRKERKAVRKEHKEIQVDIYILKFKQLLTICSPTIDNDAITLSIPNKY